MDNLKRTLTGVFETPKKATLVGPMGDRVAVEVNSSDAKKYFSKGYVLEEKPPVDPTSITTGSISGGSSPMLPQGSVNTTEDNPMMASYNSLMMDSLKKAQGVDTIELLKRQRDLQRKAITARTSDAPAGYETLSPSQRNQIRSSNATVIEKELDDNAYQLARAEKAITNFEEVFYKAQQFGTEFAEKMVIPDTMIENYKKIIEADPEKMTIVLSTLNDKSKQAVLNALDYTKLGPKKEVKEPTISEQLAAAEAGYIIKNGAIVKKIDTSGATVDDISEAIKKVESGGNYQAKGASGEFGAYQFMPGTWSSWSSEYTQATKGQSQTLIPTQENQDAIAKFKIQQWLDQGLDAQQIAAKWNSGSETGWENKIGTNKQGVAYNVPAYVEKVLNALPTKKETKFTPEFYATDYGQKVLNNEQQYQTNFLSQPAVKNYIEVANKAESIYRIVNSGVSGPADLALVFEFMKSLDPSSVVRESEYKSAAEAGNPFEALYIRMRGYTEKGQKLPENVKSEFVRMSNIKLDVYENQYEQLRNQFRKTAEEQNLNPDHVAPDLKVKFSGNTISKTIIYQGKMYNVDENGDMTEIK